MNERDKKDFISIIYMIFIMAIGAPVVFGIMIWAAIHIWTLLGIMP